ncbi:NlpC/P60 family protein [Streptomyces sp. NPDC058280]|uniref:C40 family peptidase n=1 Tax=Streptomyces sp. NPDC058280 TaxID=3346419 RepID=UPI0036EA0E91
MRKHLRVIGSRTGTRSAPRGLHRERPTSRRRGALGRAALGTCALAVLGVLAILAGAVLAVHGPSAAGPASSPSRPVVLEPSYGPTVPAPAKSKGEGKAARPNSQQRDASARAQDKGGRIAPSEGKDSRAVRPKTVRLVPGDTLYGLSEKYGTTVPALQRLNSLGGSTLIYAGDTLRLADGAESHAPKARTGSGSGSEHGTTGPSAAPKRTAPAPTAEVPGRAGAAEAIGYARAQIGKPYVWGGAGPRGYDCSGLVMRAWAKAGVKLPRTTWNQKHAGKATTRASLVPGDLVLSYGDGHIALYIGHGKVIHAPRPGTTVTVAPLPPLSRTTGYRHITS